MIGKTLAHYEIISQLGKGGMGEVYQAKDTKLGREVAIKVLPDEFAFDPDRVARFQREAKLLASINHPNIAAIHGLEESEGVHFLVMEFIPGNTLADRLKRGPIPVGDALKLSLQIAEAVEAAHEKGVIHRDLKPANIKITPEGKAKVLDFGLAKAYVGGKAASDLSNSPTLSDIATRQGVILGTSAYMSPEQATGKSVDIRADIWAFGVVLFEMLTGKKLFEGETVTETLASVIKSEPEWRSLPAELHPRIRFMLERCLKKVPKNRYGGISDARVDIQEVIVNPTGIFTASETPAEHRQGIRAILPWSVAVIMALALGGLAVWELKRSAPRKVIRFEYELPAGQHFSRDMQNQILAVSPWSNDLVYSAADGLYLRSMDELEARLIEGTEGSAPQAPFFSPDNKWIGYWSQTANKMLKIPIDGGVATPITDKIPTGLIRWYSDGKVVFAQLDEGILQTPVNGGVHNYLLQAEGHEYISPQILPDGKSILFTELGSGLKGTIVLRPGKAEENIELFPGDTAHYVSTGHIVYAYNYDLYAISFDPDNPDRIGTPILLIGGIFRANGAPQFTLSESGTLVYIQQPASTHQNTLVWVDLDGNEKPLGIEAKLFYSASISPDGRYVALGIYPDSVSNGDIWIWDTIRKSLEQLTLDDADNFMPLWTPDGRKVVYYSNKGTSDSGLFWIPVDSTGKKEHLHITLGSRLFPSSWSKDGKTLIIQKWIPPTSDIEELSMNSDHQLKPILNENHVERYPKISPDGRWIAYSSNETGQEEVYISPYPNVTRGKKVSSNGGKQPLWSPDGKELFYRRGQAVMTVSVTTDKTIHFKNSKELFRGNYLDDDVLCNWDIHPDGQRFLMIKPVTDADGDTAISEPRKITVIINWFEELKEKVLVE